MKTLQFLLLTLLAQTAYALAEDEVLEFGKRHVNAYFKNCTGTPEHTRNLSRESLEKYCDCKTRTYIHSISDKQWDTMAATLKSENPKSSPRFNEARDAMSWAELQAQGQCFKEMDPESQKRFMLEAMHPR